MERKQRKVLVGIVTSDKMDKTVVVRVERKYKHPLYKKQVISHKKYSAHNENNDVHIGDRVRIIETRPLSATKRFYVARIIERAK